MHPPLHRPHPMCEEVVQKLILCHEEHKLGKFWGACNAVKVELDACFKIEKDNKRRNNLANSRSYLMLKDSLERRPDP